MARLQLNLSPTHDALIDRVKEVSGLTTKTEVVEDALLLLHWAVVEAHKGGTIAAVDEANRTYKEILSRAIMGAKLSAQARQGGHQDHGSIAPAAYGTPIFSDPLLKPRQAPAYPMAAAAKHVDVAAAPSETPSPRPGFKTFET